MIWERKITTQWYLVLTIYRLVVWKYLFLSLNFLKMKMLWSVKKIYMGWIAWKYRWIEALKNRHVGMISCLFRKSIQLLAICIISTWEYKWNSTACSLFSEHMLYLYILKPSCIAYIQSHTPVPEPIPSAQASKLTIMNVFW